MFIRLGEPVFLSCQGEGATTGSLSIWVRTFGCSLNCSGFGQKDPTNPDTYILPQFDKKSDATSALELPVFEYGCDSGYSWSHLYKKNVVEYDFVEDICHDITALTYNGLWEHPLTGNSIDLCFTGGEPLMQQPKLLSIIDELNGNWSVEDTDRYPQRIQFETNGTQMLSDDFWDYFIGRPSGKASNFLIFNISPKLFNVSGEKYALKFDAVERIYDFCFETGAAPSLKFVINNSDAAWDEMNRFVAKLRKEYIDITAYVMPVGATKEKQEDSEVISKIADRAIAEGYHVSGRIHANIWGNTVGK